MIRYEPKDWFTFFFRLHKSDTLRQLFPLIVGICLYAWGVAYLELEIWKLSEDSKVKNVSILHTLLGVVISFLLVFRSNTAYDRWWEGRKLWGSLVNTSRNLAIKIGAVFHKDPDTLQFFRNMIPLYSQVLKNHLRNEHTSLTLFEDLGADLQFELDHEKHRPNQVALLMIRKIHEAYEGGKISGEQLLFLNAELQSFTDICGACERIKNTPIPFSYSGFIKKFIFFYVMTLPFGFVFNLGYYVIPIVAFIFYVLASLELIAEEIEEPFGGDENDLPLGKISHNIKVHIHELL